jgi:hypothetical protein
MSDEKLSPQEGNLRKKPIVVTVIGIILIYLLALRTGAAFVYFGLVSPDTCWLLKLGSIIAVSGAIPKTDPFSFTLPLYASMGEPQSYVVYQWLSEVAFFFGFRFFHFAGLLAAAAILISIAYLVIPLRACVRLNAPAIWSFLAVAAASTAVNLRSFIRPEIFSCLFLSLWLWLLLPLRARGFDDSGSSATNDIDWKVVGLLAGLMVVWCNMHTGFVSGIIVLGVYAFASWLEDFRAQRRLCGSTKTLLLCLIASILGSLVNPYGIGLWLYLPHLFFDPINNEIKELQGIKSTMLFQSLRFPLVCLVILCYGAIALLISKNRKQSPDFLKSPVRLSSLLLVITATVLSFTKRRLVSLGAVVMLIETAHFIGSRKAKDAWPPLFWHKKISILVVELMILILAPRGVFDIANKSIILSVPQLTSEFQPPLKAMMFFNHNYDEGRIFGSTQISDMLDLYFSPKNSIFMDTRLDIYSPKIRQDFETICSARGNWKDLLDTYQIKWVFVEPRAEIGEVLERESGWKIQYRDSSAKIFKREP